MILTILSIVAGIIAAIPAILKRLDIAQKAHSDEADQNARQDSNLLDTIVPPTDPPRV